MFQIFPYRIFPPGQECPCPRFIVIGYHLHKTCRDLIQGHARTASLNLTVLYEFSFLVCLEGDSQSIGSPIGFPETKRNIEGLLW
jgi:hypothetical protein